MNNTHIDKEAKTVILDIGDGPDGVKFYTDRDKSTVENVADDSLYVEVATAGSCCTFGPMLPNVTKMLNRLLSQTLPAEGESSPKPESKCDLCDKPDVVFQAGKRFCREHAPAGTICTCNRNYVDDDEHAPDCGKVHPPQPSEQAKGAEPSDMAKRLTDKLWLSHLGMDVIRNYALEIDAAFAAQHKAEMEAMKKGASR